MTPDHAGPDVKVTTSTPLEDHPVILVARVVLGCAAAILAVVGSMNPSSIAWWGFNQAVPHLAEMLLTLMMVCAAIIGSVSRVSKALWRSGPESDSSRRSIP